jgi:undecaprenyl pyrophosphate phosphatase UppP
MLFNNQVNPVQVLISGIVEGITDFLFISSTGRLMLTAGLAGFSQTDTLKDF